VNFLAHLYLSPETPDALIGSLLGDFVKGPVERAGYNAEITGGIRLHRAVDTFTDAHPAFAASRARVSPARRRYAGILVDLFYDHFLARHWRDYHDQRLETFAAGVYGVLLDRAATLPEPAGRMVGFMVRQDWLVSYRDVDAVGGALERMGRRLTRGNALLGSAAELESAYEGFEADFRTFMPEVSDFARTHGASTPVTDQDSDTRGRRPRNFPV
jgi:acyl carrier protein phosphodiesterase